MEVVQNTGGKIELVPKGATNALMGMKETEVADLLGLKVSTLRAWRLKGNQTDGGLAVGVAINQEGCRASECPLP